MIPNLNGFTIVGAKLPAVYSAAKEAVSKCARVDECKDWANKAEALSSYAKQANDDELEKMATRIKARAIRRCGELIREIEAAKNQHDAKKRAGSSAATGSKRAAAKEAGM